MTRPRGLARPAQKEKPEDFPGEASSAQSHPLGNLQTLDFSFPWLRL